MITISGLPCVGKTTFINKLCARFPKLYRINEYQRTVDGSIDWQKYLNGNIDIVVFQKRMMDYVVNSMKQAPKDSIIIIDKNPWYGVDVYCYYDLQRKYLSTTQYDEIANYYSLFFKHPTKTIEITCDDEFEKYLDGKHYDLVLRAPLEVISQRMKKRGDPGEWDYYFRAGHIDALSALDKRF